MRSNAFRQYSNKERIPQALVSSSPRLRNRRRDLGEVVVNPNIQNEPRKLSPAGLEPTTYGLKVIRSSIFPHDRIVEKYRFPGEKGSLFAIHRNLKLA
jgi:hypothetical protein